MHVLERSAEGQALGCVGVPEAVRSDGGREAGCSAEPLQLVEGATVGVGLGAVTTHEDGAGRSAGQVLVEGTHDRRREDDPPRLVALAHDAQHPVAVVVGEVRDVDGQRFGDATSAEHEYRHQRQ